MKIAFADTSALVAMYDGRDSLHAASRSILSSWDGAFCTTNAVVGETYTFLRYSGHASLAHRLLTESLPFRVMRVLEEHESSARDILLRYSEHDFSYIDALSFAFMRAQGLEEAFAFDKHFHTAGFRLIGYGSLWS